MRAPQPQNIAAAPKQDDLNSNSSFNLVVAQRKTKKYVKCVRVFAILLIVAGVLSVLSALRNLSKGYKDFFEFNRSGNYRDRNLQSASQFDPTVGPQTPPGEFEFEDDLFDNGDDIFWDDEPDMNYYNNNYGKQDYWKDQDNVSRHSHESLKEEFYIDAESIYGFFFLELIQSTCIIYQGFIGLKYTKVTSSSNAKKLFKRVLIMVGIYMLI